MKTRLKITGQSRRAKWIIYPTAVLAIVNFFVFAGASEYLGGDALNGHIHAGHYFLCAHGHCTEVSSSLWHYSWWHAVSALVGLPLVLAETAVLLNTGDIQFE